jgi:hypothetical protein
MWRITCGVTLLAIPADLAVWVSIRAMPWVEILAPVALTSRPGWLSANELLAEIYI